MESRRRRVRVHAATLAALGGLVCIIVVSLIGCLIASNIQSPEPEISSENAKCLDCEDFFTILKKIEEELKQGAIEAGKKALEERIAKATGIIYLTFDDGPGDYTASLLDILKSRNTKATFFVTGAGNDDIIKREYDEGHTVGLHTWSHRYNLIYASVENYFNDLSQIADRVKRITGEDSKIIRFPGGSSNTVSTRYDKRIKIMSILTSEVEKRGYQYFDWNIDSGDAENINTADAVYNNVVSHLKPGPNVVLQHDIKDFSVEAVGRIIDFGLSNNYIFLPLDFDSYTAHHRVNN